MKLQFNKYKIHHFGKDYTILTPKVSFDNLYVCEADSNRNIVFGDRKDLINLGNYIGCLYSQQNTILYVPAKKKPTDYLKGTFQIDRAYDLVLSSHSVQLKLKDWKAIRQKLKKHEVVSIDIKLPPIKDEDTRNFWYRSNKDVLRIKNKYDTLFLEASKIIYRHMIEVFYYVGENGEKQFYEYIGSHCHEHLDVYMGYNNRTSIDTINTVEFYDEELWRLPLNNITKCIDGISFDLKSDYDFSWLNQLGKVFVVFDQQDSGNICFGLEKDGNKYFVKYAGAPTINYSGSPENTIIRMKESIRVYEDVKHPNLIKLIDHYECHGGYLSIYEWNEGECLHAHWNFENCPKYKHPDSPNVKFNRLAMKHKLQCLDDIFNLHELITGEGYVPIDFYDGSIMYDFETNTTTICDIEFYHKGPLLNTMGRMWGSSRFMSPEEFEKGAIIDEVTTVFVMGATAFELLGSNQTRDLDTWNGSEELFEVAKKATSEDRDQRYSSVSEFYNEWKRVTMDQTIRSQNKESYNQNSNYRDTKEIAEWKLPIFDGFVAYLADKQLTDVLDLGAGSGVCSQYFDNDDINIKCIDASDKMVELCLAKGLDAQVMDFYNIKFEDKSFDAVWAMNSLLHVPKKSLSSVLEGISRILADDGVFYIGVYGGESSEGVYEDDFYVPPRFFARYTDEELKAALAKHFTILSFNHIDLDNDGFWFQSVYLKHK